MFFLAVLDFQLSSFGLIMYALAFLGSFSLGYLLLRTAFPGKQKMLLSEKLQFGYIIGAPLIVISSIFGEQYFFFVFTFLSVLVFAIAYTKRISFKEDDYVALEKIEKKSFIPEKGLTKEEQQASAEGRPMPGRVQRQPAPVPQTKRIVATEIKPINISPKEQVFKENKPIIQSNNAGAPIQDNVKEKAEILKRLKSLGKEVKKAKDNGKVIEETNDDFKIEDLDLE